MAVFSAYKIDHLINEMGIIFLASSDAQLCLRQTKVFILP